MPRAHGALIRQRRHERDLSAADLAEKVQVVEGTLRNVENGSTTASMRLLHRLSRELEVPVEQLIAPPTVTAGGNSDETTHPDPTHPPNKKRSRQRTALSA